MSKRSCWIGGRRVCGQWKRPRLLTWRFKSSGESGRVVRAVLCRRKLCRRGLQQGSRSGRKSRWKDRRGMRLVRRRRKRNERSGGSWGGGGKRQGGGVGHGDGGRV